MKTNPPEITDYLDIIDYLNAHFIWRKANEPNFSYGQWQEELGLAGRTLMRMILHRKRKISPKTAAVLKSNMGLTINDNYYFDVLLSYSQAKTQVERKLIGANLLKIQRSKYQPMIVEKDLISKDALIPIVLALMTYKDIPFDLKTLSRILNIDTKKIEEILAFLSLEKIITLQADGQYSFAAEGVKFSGSPGNPHLKKFYQYWLDQAKAALDSPVETRRYRSLQFALSREEFIDVHEQINEFAIQLLGKYKSSSMINRRLYMLESILFPISNEYLKMGEEC